MESIPKGNLSFFDDEEEGKPNEQEAKTHMTLSVVEGEADSSAIAESSHIVMPTMYTRTEHSSSTSPNGGQQFMHNSLPQRESHGLPSSQKVPDSLDISEYMHPRRRRAPYFLKESIPVAKAKMLKFKGFDQFVEITPDEQEGWINIMARSEDEFINIQIHMHACLEQVITVKKEEVMDKTLVEFLDTSPCRKCLNDELTEKQIEAVLDVDTKLCKLVVHAYTDVNLDKAFNVVDKILILRDIPLQPHEVDAIAMAVDRVSQMNSQLVRIIMSPKSVKLYSLDSKVVDEIERQISNTKRELKPKEVVYEIETQISNTKRELKPKDVSFTASVELCNAKARCFNQHLSIGLQAAVRQRNGQYLPEQSGNDENIKLTITVIGEPGLKDLLEQTVNKVWKERFDFAKVSTDADDKWLLVKGLSGEEGRTFLKHCELTFDCCIDQLKGGTVHPPTGKSRVTVQTTEDLSSSSSSADDVSQDAEAVVDYETRPKRMVSARPIGADTYIQLQGPYDDNAALAPALQQSLELERPSPDGNRSLTNTRNYSQQMNGMQILVVKGDVTTEKADALVNMVAPNMDFGETTVSKAFGIAAGQELERSYAMCKVKGLNVNGVIVTPGFGQLICKVVIHVGLIVGKDKCKSCLSNVIPQILQECEKSRCQSIALSPLGLGRMYKYEADDCAEQTFLSLNQYHNSGIMKDVKIVVYDDKTLQVFTTALKSASQRGTSNTKPSVSTAGSRPSNQAVYSKPTAPHFHRNNGNSGQQARAASSPNLQSKTRRTTRHRSSRVKYQAVTDLNITVFAKDKPTCVNALKEMGKKMKQELLFEKKIEMIPSLSKETKSEIAKVIEKHTIISIKEKDHFLLKGKRDGVLSAHSSIMGILLKNPRSSNTKRRADNTKRETVEFARAVAQEEPIVPTYWKHYKEGETLANRIMGFIHRVKGQDYEKVDIPDTSRTYSKIVRMIMETTEASFIGQGKDASGLQPGKYSKLWVTKIQRIENLSLFRKYCQKRQSLFEQLVKQGQGAWPKVENLPKSSGPIVLQKLAYSKMVTDLHSEINEVLLFHGTKGDTIDTICQGGLDPRLGSGKAMFGPGVYGAEKALKADQYTDDPTTRTYGQGNSKKMFLMRMLLGQCFLCVDQNPTKYKRAPCCKCFSDVCKQHPQRFDSVIGDNQKLFREFVVYDGGQCYPEYLITYERR